MTVFSVKLSNCEANKGERERGKEVMVVIQETLVLMSRILDS